MRYKNEMETIGQKVCGQSVSERLSPFVRSFCQCGHLLWMHFFVCVREKGWWLRQTIYPVLNRPDEHWMNEWSARPQYIMCSKCSFIKASDVPSTNLPTLLNLFQTWNKLLFLIFMKPTLAEIFVKPMRVGDSVIKFLCDVSNRLSSNCQERKMSMEG